MERMFNESNFADEEPGEEPFYEFQTSFRVGTKQPAMGQMKFTCKWYDILPLFKLHNNLFISVMNVAVMLH
jgi:hypothetical protein